MRHASKSAGTSAAPLCAARPSLTLRRITFSAEDHHASFTVPPTRSSYTHCPIPSIRAQRSGLWCWCRFQTGTASRPRPMTDSPLPHEHKRSGLHTLAPHAHLLALSLHLTPTCAGECACVRGMRRRPCPTIVQPLPKVAFTPLTNHAHLPNSLDTPCKVRGHACACVHVQLIPAAPYDPGEQGDLLHAEVPDKRDRGGPTGAGVTRGHCSSYRFLSSSLVIPSTVNYLINCNMRCVSKIHSSHFTPLRHQRLQRHIDK
jgi:hypothetical protein